MVFSVLPTGHTSKGISGERWHQYQNKLKQEVMGHEVLFSEQIKKETGFKVKSLRRDMFAKKTGVVLVFSFFPS